MFWPNFLRSAVEWEFLARISNVNSKQASQGSPYKTYLLFILLFIALGFFTDTQ